MGAAQPANVPSRFGRVGSVVLPLTKKTYIGADRLFVHYIHSELICTHGEGKKRKMRRIHKIRGGATG